MSQKLAGRRVLVTGASSGIGAEVCRSIVSYGGSVAMVARRKERLDELRDELGEPAVPIACDVTDDAAHQAAVEDAARQLGGLDGVVAVAGRSMVGTLATGSPERWSAMFDLNLVAPLASAQFAMNHFADSGRRDVVLIGSCAGIVSMPGTGIYSASKRGLQAAFESLRLELAPLGINASLVMPGMFETEGLTMEGVEFNGEVPANDFPILVPDCLPADPAILADMISYMIGLPDGVCINELVTRPTGQYNP
jgi:NADP-dependent 3-hydroxy acid dehydrogenase YdfG